MVWKKIGAAVLLCLTLSACFQLQVLGTVTGATFVVTPLRAPGTVLHTGTTWSDGDWLAIVSQADWDSWQGYLQLIVLGIFYPNNGQLDPDALYLVTASGGLEQDANLDQLRDPSGTPVRGEIHAIASGAQIARGGFKVSSLTDAVYRWLAPELDGLSDAQVLARLQQAAERIVGDSNEDGAVDYLDVLYWNRLIDGAEFYRHGMDNADALGAALVAGSAAADLYPLAEAALSGYDAAYWRQLLAELDDGGFDSAGYLYDSPPDVANCNPGVLSDAAQQRALMVLNKTRELHGLAPVSHASNYDADAQASSLIQTANSYLSHFPNPGDACYSDGGADAAATSNIGNGSRSNDPAQNVIGWTDDSFNVGNLAQAGHRRWNLNPFMNWASYGQVGGGNTLKVFDFEREMPMNPAVSVDYVAFPYRYYPHVFLSNDPGEPTPWSFSVIENRGNMFGNQHPYFSNATIEVRRASDGALLTVHSRHSDTQGFGVPNFLSWQVSDWAYDTLYQVTIGNVMMHAGQTRDFSYPVFIDYAYLVDLTEPLEPGDSADGTHIVGTLADGDDRDSYEVSLSGQVTVNATSQFSNWAFFVLVYGPDKQLIRADDEPFSLDLPAGTYTIVASNCNGNSCYSGGKTYTIDVN
jgi:hypothetical protein